MLLLVLMLIRSTSIASVPITTGCFKLWYCFWYFYLSTIIPFITKSSMTNIIFKRSAYYLDTLDDSAGDNNDYDTSIVMLLWPYRPIFLSVAGCGDAPLTIQINNLLLLLIRFTDDTDAGTFRFGYCMHCFFSCSSRFKSINITNNYFIRRCSNQVFFCCFYRVHFVWHLQRLD